LCKFVDHSKNANGTEFRAITRVRDGNCGDEAVGDKSGEIDADLTDMTRNLDGDQANLLPLGQKFVKEGD
jgi:hypothetical protein